MAGHPARGSQHLRPSLQQGELTSAGKPVSPVVGPGPPWGAAPAALPLPSRIPGPDPPMPPTPLNTGLPRGEGRGCGCSCRKEPHHQSEVPRAPVGTPRQGHTKVSKQVWGRGRAGLRLCLSTCPLGGGCTGCSSSRPRPSRTSAQGPHGHLIVLATPGSAAPHMGWVLLGPASGWTERATAVANQGSRARGG